jgi:hypothetical protein
MDVLVREIDDFSMETFME